MCLWIQHMMIREPRPQRSFDSSAGLIAVFHALRRLLAPRHPPHALSSLAALIPPSRPRVATRTGSRHQHSQVTDPRLHTGGRVTILSLFGLMQRSQETVTRPAYAGHA